MTETVETKRVALERSNLEDPQERFGRADGLGPAGARTLTMIRWVALMGQLVSLLVVHFGLGFPLPLEITLGIVAFGAFYNLVCQSVRQSSRTAAFGLAFDIAQLAYLLYWTGGLQNPFALMLIAPVTVSATILSGRATVWLSFLALISATLLAVVHQPLPWPEEALQLPDLYVVGLWVAIVIATLFIAGYTYRVNRDARRMSDAFAATRLALSREQQLSALGGLAAAAAHELGTPLSTIAVVARELRKDLPEDSEWREDVELLLSESARCRDILTEFSRRPDQDTGGPFKTVPFSAMVESAAAPHQREDVVVIIEQHGPDGALDLEPGEAAAADQPRVVLTPEMNQGIGTLVQNAVQFASETVEITVYWDENTASIIIEDDGPGFAPLVLDRLGEPYVSSRAGQDGHMGLGIFIAKTLLERGGASLAFSNRAEGGARVAVRWTRPDLEAGVTDS
ncbi:ActS/PrrB/RegB family redox-sensitive histidine kinase [Nisaea acidiphila]|uniref:histidine kinase n=1 Tax=Nisaea acidiphila TaxID=1862145 RepID=A0A9J7AZ49_9PROT|nr:ActS/PrrB/RegB family redox-sensitive histidine kinase [Nisaea acidiphila]UUX52058.1 ActS/PrrB/RegB family redox-sensitive histidine kinase [Nisaea acidiphila]